MAFTQSERLNALPPYLFAEIDRKKSEAIKAGRDVIDFGVGDPDLPTHKFIIDVMQRAIQDPAHHRYPLGGGMPEFRRRIAGFFQRRYGVQLDPEAEILALIGSKEGIGHLPLAVVNPGETVLVPAPGYPVYYASTIFAGGKPHVFDLDPASGWRADLSRIPSGVARDARLLFLNYPNNPTGAVVDLAFFKEAVNFARENDLLIAHDAAYNELYFGDAKPPSILEVPEARDVAIEFHSASKTFNMTGWRIGFAAGNADAVAALRRIKSNLDSGVFSAIQEAAWVAYDNIDRPEIHEMYATYQQRASLLCDALRSLGFDAHPPVATFYVWARVPAGLDSMTVCNRLLDEADVVGIPGNGFGRIGEGYVRFSLSVPTERIRAAVERMRGLQW